METQTSPWAPAEFGGYMLEQLKAAKSSVPVRQPSVLFSLIGGA